ncbi:hypothetical protein KQX54_014627 [Cotesia glomerata]|uniref:Uncharacterized protein n=1 Tax=Cotesia glomerata TaxID=32391 RepID=A0AAV7I5Y8_COTGL|nr:hypothetical protein KQX54_014627 [Cotesia glomerata]
MPAYILIYFNDIQASSSSHILCYSAVALIVKRSKRSILRDLIKDLGKNAKKIIFETFCRIYQYISIRCTRTKEELSANIYQRLKWMMYVEDKMMVVDGKLAMYHENLKRLCRHLEVLLQIHLVPQMDVSAVSEVARRRKFSQAFLVMASNLACQLLTVHNEEIARCREFQSKFDGNFFGQPISGFGACSA